MFKPDENFAETSFLLCCCHRVCGDFSTRLRFFRDFTLMFTFLIVEHMEFLGHITSVVYSNDKHLKCAITPRY